MRLALLTALLLSAATVLAQDSKPASVTPSHVEVVGVLNLACPVGMRAERQALGQQLWVVSLEDAGRLQPIEKFLPNTAGVHVVLDEISAKKMSRAQVAVYYIAPDFHVLPVDEGRPVSASELKKIFVLTSANAAPSLRLTGSLRVGPASSVTRVRLLKITYEDGSTWQASSGSECTANPSLMMAVAAR